MKVKVREQAHRGPLTPGVIGGVIKGLTVVRDGQRQVEIKGEFAKLELCRGLKPTWADGFAAKPLREVRV